MNDLWDDHDYCDIDNKHTRECWCRPGEDPEEDDLCPGHPFDGWIITSRELNRS